MDLAGEKEPWLEGPESGGAARTRPCPDSTHEPPHDSRDRWVCRFWQTGAGGGQQSLSPCRLSNAPSSPDFSVQWQWLAGRSEFDRHRALPLCRETSVHTWTEIRHTAIDPPQKGCQTLTTIFPILTARSPP